MLELSSENVSRLSVIVGLRLRFFAAVLLIRG